MFFKNQETGSYGQSKPPTYRGLRPKIFDPPIADYLAIKALQINDPRDYSRNQRLIDWCRYFVSVLNEELNPEWIEKRTNYSKLSGGGSGDSVSPTSATRRSFGGLLG